MANRTRNLALWILLVAAAGAFGMILTGSLHITPPTSAANPTSATAASAAKSSGIPSFADVADAVLNSVVSIQSTEIVQARKGLSPFGDGDPFEFFFGPRRGTPQTPQERRAGGSGFIISTDGEILTNNHVVSGAQKIQVKLRDREVLTAKILGTDPVTDVALIKVEPKHKLPALALGDSDKLRVADWVIAVGNPLFFEGTVTVGVISGKGRGGLSDDPNTTAFENYLQTDAAINFGNSGGPLVDPAGRVVGINTAMIQPAQNIGFAVPINTAKAILPQLKTKGKVTRSLLGVRIAPVDQSIMEAFHLPSMNGAFVQSVDPDLPAAKAGVRHGDTIVRVDEVEVKEPRDLINYVSAKPPGSKVKLTVIRDGKTLSLTVTLAEREASEGEQTERGAGRESAHGKLGISVAELSADVRQQLGISSGVTGVVIASVTPLSPADDAGLAQGDIVTEINGAPVKSISQFRSELEKVKKGDYVRLYVQRFQPQPISRYVVVRME